MAGLPPQLDAYEVVVVELHEVDLLDLTDSRVLAQLGVHREQIVQPSSSWKGRTTTDPLPLTWALGIAARERFCGLLVPSWLEAAVHTAHSLDNVVIFQSTGAPWQPERGSITLRDAVREYP